MLKLSGKTHNNDKMFTVKTPRNPQNDLVYALAASKKQEVVPAGAAEDAFNVQSVSR